NRQKRDRETAHVSPYGALTRNFVTGINPYAGAWTSNEVIHLLKRLCYGAPREDVDYFLGMSYAQSVDELLNTLN
ncbi:hypothetical protein LIZ99_22010, partial [Parabacteroides distasonis]|uniref:hypothetical protein n=1 Tax=Parabacteroides distasonis TaxID=823 RepID=UPI001D094BFA